MANRFPLPRPIDVRRLVAAALLALGTVGCGGVRLHPVEGSVALDGKPVAYASVMFHPKDKGPVGEAVTDADGKFVLRCMNRPGVPAGDYFVTIIKQKTTGVAESPDGLSSGATGPIRVEFLVPEKFGKIAEPILEAKVPGEKYHFEISSK